MIAESRPGRRDGQEYEFQEAVIMRSSLVERVLLESPNQSGRGVTLKGPFHGEGAADLAFTVTGRLVVGVDLTQSGFHFRSQLILFAMAT